MKINRIHMFLGLSGVVLLLATVPLWRDPWLFSIRRAIDVSSGDLLRQTYICGFRFRQTTEVTPLSAEGRRLGIVSAETPEWRRLSADVIFGRPISYRYDGVTVKCNFVVELLNTLDIPDVDRSVLLQDVLKSLQTGELLRIDDILQRLGEQLQSPGGAKGVMP